MRRNAEQSRSESSERRTFQSHQVASSMAGMTSPGVGSKASLLKEHFSREDVRSPGIAEQFSRASSMNALSSAHKKMSFQTSHGSSIDKPKDASYIVTSVDDDDGHTEPMVSSPASSPPVARKMEQSSSSSLAHKAKYQSDNFMAAKSMAQHQGMARMESKDMTFEHRNEAKQMKSSVDMEGYSASKSSAVRQDQKMVRVGDNVHQEQSMVKNASRKMCTGDASAEQRAFQSKKEATTISGGMVKQEQSHSSSQSSRYVSKSGTMSSLSRSETSQMFSTEFATSALKLGDGPGMQFGMFGLPSVGSGGLLMIQDVTGDPSLVATDDEGPDIELKLTEAIEKLKQTSDDSDGKKDEQIQLTGQIYDLMRKSWFGLGSDFAEKLCDIIREKEALDIVIEHCAAVPDSQNGPLSAKGQELQLATAQLLPLILHEPNNAHLAQNGPLFGQLVRFACSCSQQSSLDSHKYAKLGTGILAQLFVSSQDLCKCLIKNGALSTIWHFCRSFDVETTRNCAFAIANLALFGGPDLDEHVRYASCLAIAILVSNKEIETFVIKSQTLNLVERFIGEHSAQDFACSQASRAYGQTKGWLERLVPVLDSDREVAKSLAAFHFAVVAHIRKGRKGQSFAFADIGAIDALRRVASSPNAVASKYAALALQIIGEEVPHKLSQQVPLWSVDDVREWVKQVGFQSYANEFVHSRVDGDLLLQLTETMLRDDIGMVNGILRKRFLRELAHLKKMTDYAACDGSTLYDVLNSLGSVYSQYTYSMLQCGVDVDILKSLTEEQLVKECHIQNSIHRLKIIESLKTMGQSAVSLSPETKKNLDVFVSYRRSNGSQLASLLKVMLQMRGFTTFIDVERLEAGKFDSNLIRSIQQAKHFILVLTPNALDRCINDKECKDWVHKEIVEALKNGCNIIPVTENFDWPEPEKLPDDMRALCRFNGIRWIHEYQDACIDKLDRFMKGITIDLEQQGEDDIVPTSSPRRESKTTKPGKLKKFFLKS
ncbi:NAD(+) hydrolase sarm1 [Halotydeus destructor]|nr:NAD(+) hydrolase sarm1 [Halotydeus destructor]